MKPDLPPPSPIYSHVYISSLHEAMIQKFTNDFNSFSLHVFYAVKFIV